MTEALFQIVGLFIFPTRMWKRHARKLREIRHLLGSFAVFRFAKFDEEKKSSGSARWLSETGRHGERAPAERGL